MEASKNLDPSEEEKQERRLKVARVYPEDTALDWKLPRFGKIDSHYSGNGDLEYMLS